MVFSNEVASDNNSAAVSRLCDFSGESAVFDVVDIGEDDDPAAGSSPPGGSFVIFSRVSNLSVSFAALTFDTFL